MLSLLSQRRFLPFFLVQFLGAFNDNLYKNALLVLLALEIRSGTTLSFYTNISMALFILPMFIFSAWSGLLAERIEKRRLIIWIKSLELVIVSLGVLAFLLHNYWLMIVVLFLLGLQSAFFGPVKYGLLPERLDADELMAGNGLIEASTFLAILFGTLLGGYLVGDEAIRYLLYVFLPATAVFGLLSAYFLPAKSVSAHQTGLPAFKPWQQTLTLLSFTRQDKRIFQSILAISWFWLLGGAFLTQMPHYTTLVLGADETVITYLLVLFSIGVGLGSLLSNTLSKGKIEAGLVPLGAFLMAFFMWQVIQVPIFDAPSQPLSQLGEFYHDPRFWSVSIAFTGLAIAGGIYVVPLYAVIQRDAPNGYKSQTIAANNIINALFLVLVSVLSILALSVFKWSLIDLFTLLLILHLMASIYLFTVVPEFILRLIVMILTTFFYRIKVIGSDNMPNEGAAIYICNHVSYMDALIIMANSRRPVRFVMYYKIFSVPVLSWLFKAANAIPIASRQENADIYQRGMLLVDEALRNGEIVGLFPEGQLTPDGDIQPFKRGITIMLNKNPVPVIPMALGNLWGSFFSYKQGLFKGYPRKWMAEVTLQIGQPLPPSTSVGDMEAVVRALKENSVNNSKNH